MLQSGVSAGESVYAHLLEQFCPFFIVASLQADTYSLVNGSSFFKEGLPQEGLYDDLVETIASTLQPEHRGHFIGKFARDSLFTSFSRMEKRVELDAAFFGEDEVYHWIRLGLIFLGLGESDGDIRFALYFRLIDEEKRQEVEARSLKRVFSMIVPEAFEYIAVVDATSGMFEMFAASAKGAHSLPLMGDYETMIALVRDAMVPEAQRDDFSRASSLPKLQKSLQGAGDVFRYRAKTRQEEEFEISFRPFNNEMTQLLLAIRKN
jgi:hypothetical protein